MTEKRYQVFISSTFEDLKEERRAVQDIIIGTGDFPVQMESFPAADENQFAFIKSLIDKCDYYVLIIAGKYGTSAPDGMSYTEKEYRYASSIGVPILVMLHGDRGKISAEKSETTEEGKTRLAKFIEEAQDGRLRKSWTTLDGLKLVVREALDNAKATKPRVGWVRGDTVASVQALEELNEVRKENENFKKSLGDLTIALALPPLPDPYEIIEFHLLPNTIIRSVYALRGSEASIQTNWISMFPVFYRSLDWRTSDGYDEISYWIDEDSSCIAIGSTIAGKIEPIDTENYFKISKDSLHRLMNYYIEAELMYPPEAGKPFAEPAEKMARRHSFADDRSRMFLLKKGKISVSDPSSLDDEIPF